MAHTIKGFLFCLKEKICLGQNFGVSNSENSNKYLSTNIFYEITKTLLYIRL